MYANGRESVHVHSEAVPVHVHEDTNGIRTQKTGVNVREKVFVYVYVNGNEGALRLQRSSPRAAVNACLRVRKRFGKLKPFSIRRHRHVEDIQDRGDPG